MGEPRKAGKGTKLADALFFRNYVWGEMRDDERKVARICANLLGLLWLVHWVE